MKRLLALVSAVCLLLTVFCFTAFAAGEQPLRAGKQIVIHGGQI